MKLFKCNLRSTQELASSFITFAIAVPMLFSFALGVLGSYVPTASATSQAARLASRFC